MSASRKAHRASVLDALTPTSTVVFALVLLNQASFYLVMPFLALYLHQGLGLSVPTTGLLVGIPFLSALVFGIPSGALSDRLGLLRSFLLAMVAFAVTTGSIAFLHGVVPLAVALALSGIARPMASASLQGLGNRAVPPEQRGNLQTALYWAANMGIVIGLLVSAEALRGGLSPAPFLVMGAVGLLAAAVGGSVLRGLAQGATAAAGPGASRSTRALFALALSDRPLLYAALTFALFLFMEIQTSSTMPLDIAARVSGAGHVYGPLLAVESVTVLLATPLAMRLLSKRHALAVFAAGSLVGAVGLALGGALDTVALWAAGMILYGVGEAVASTTLNPLIARLPGPSNAGLYFAVVITAQTFGAFAGSSGGILALRYLGRDVLFPGMVLVALASIWTFRSALWALERKGQASAPSALATTTPG